MGAGIKLRNKRAPLSNRPPGSLEGLRKYHRRRGFMEEPLLQNRDPNAILTFAKPLPIGRIHIHIYQYPRTYVIDSHIDKADPSRDPLGHIRDIIISPSHQIQRIRRTD